MVGLRCAGAEYEKHWNSLSRPKTNDSTKRNEMSAEVAPMKMKFLSVLAGLVVFLGTASQGWSALLIQVGTQPAFDWENASATVLDKTFTWIGDNIPLLSKASARMNDPTSVDDTFVLELTDLELLATPASFTLEYSVTIDRPDYVFATVGLDSVQYKLGTSVTKEIYSDAFSTRILNLSSLNGSSNEPVAIPENLSKIWVRDTVLVNQGGQLRNLTNTFTQRAVPEPASLAIWGGMAVVGLAFTRRRMK